MRSPLLIGLTLFLLCAPAVSAEVDGWTNHACLNNTTLLLWEEIHTNTGLYTSNQTVFCKHGCDNRTRACLEPYRPDYIQASMSLPLFLMLFFLGLGSLGWGVFKKKFLLCFFATIFFFVLAFQSMALEAFFVGSMFSSLAPILVYLNWLLAIVALLFTLISGVSYARGHNEQELV